MQKSKRQSRSRLSAVALAIFVVASPCLQGKDMKARPFVKWAGGKGQLVEQLDALLPKDFQNQKDIIYVEPFVGGGAMLFHVLVKYPNISRAVVNDMNCDLVTCYRIIKEKPDELIATLKHFQDEYWNANAETSRKKMFLEKRDRYNQHVANDVETAALFIFLNRTCFNGLYRVNSKGLYTGPFGKAKHPLICDEDTLRADNAVLQKVEILCGDYSQVTNVINGQTFFYFDPPYRPLTKTAAFTAYSKSGFDDNEQLRLAEFCKMLDVRGHRWLLSNSDPHNTDPKDDFFDDLFCAFDIHRVFASRAINSKADGRGKISELAIRNYKE